VPQPPTCAGANLVPGSSHCAEFPSSSRLMTVMTSKRPSRCASMLDTESLMSLNFAWSSGGGGRCQPSSQKVFLPRALQNVALPASSSAQPQPWGSPYFPLGCVSFWKHAGTPGKLDLRAGTDVTRVGRILNAAPTAQCNGRENSRAGRIPLLSSAGPLPHVPGG
jgi:hypothetical protein